MRSAFEELVRSGDLTVVEAIEIPPRAERRRKIPDVFEQGAIGKWIRDTIASDGTLWQHQSLALDALARGLNVAVATGTASGKSLIFQIAVLEALVRSDARSLVLYPLKALLGDQLLRWRDLARQLGFSSEIVAELHGHVLTEDRLNAVRSARVIVATPDVIHAWFMRQAASPLFKDYLRGMRYLILDEAHVYESVFGSNFAYLMRRFLSVYRRAIREKGPKHTLQLIATTATISDPEQHLSRLTGWQFDVVSDSEDGSPSHRRTLYHIEGPDTGNPAEVMLADVLHRTVSGGRDGAFIAFHNSRQGVERVARTVDQEDVFPYRSGYEIVDRARIERALRAGQIRGVISTSALELGIDIPNFSLGLNLGVPQSRKSFRQRIGRVGRAGAGVFGVIAPRYAFARFGTTFREYYNGSVEPSHIYLDNRFIQFAHARCLIDESESFGADLKEVPPGVNWPGSFKGVYDTAKPGAPRPREYDYIAQLGADSPHLNYPLRQVGEANYKIVEGSRDQGDRIGDITVNQAIREAYPGALYLHLRQPKKVVEWRTSSFDRVIRVETARNASPTRPILRTTVNVSTSPEDIVGGRMMTGPTGLVAEVGLQVNESVMGFTNGSRSLLYKDLRSQDPRMTRKQREFRTTGIVIRIEEDWFSRGGKQVIMRQALAEALKEMLAREKSISTNDIDGAHSNIAFYVNGAPRRVTDTVVIYDSIYGGLRLTEPLYDYFEDFLERLRRGAQEAGPDAFVSEDIAEKLLVWYASLKQGTIPSIDALAPRDGEYVIYAPGSEVSLMYQGVLIERRLISPVLFPLGASTVLMYKYDTGGRGEGWIAHDQVQPTGQDYSMAYWNPTTGEMRAADDDERG